MKIIIAVVLLMPCLLWGQTRYYVRAGAAGSGNSRSDAAGDLHEVLQGPYQAMRCGGRKGGITRLPERIAAFLLHPPGGGLPVIVRAQSG